MTTLTGRISSRSLSHLIAVVIVLLSVGSLVASWLRLVGLDALLASNWPALGIAFCLVPISLVLIRNGHIRRQFFRGRLMQLIIALMALIMVKALIGLFSGQLSIWQSIGWAITWLGPWLFFLVCSFVANRTDWLRLYWRSLILIPAIIIIAYGTLQLFVLAEGSQSYLGLGSGASTSQSLMQSSAAYGGYLIMIITTLATLVMTRNHIRLWRVLLLGLALVGLVATSLFGLMAALVASLIVAMFLCCKTNSQRRRAAFVGSCLIIAWIVGFGLSGHGLIDSGLLASASVNGAEHLVGTSLQLGGVDSSYLALVYGQLGLIGLGLTLVILLALGRSWLRERSATLNRVLLASLVGLLIASSLSLGLADNYLLYLWLGLAGIGYGSQIARGQERLRAKHNAK